MGLRLEILPLPKICMMLLSWKYQSNYCETHLGNFYIFLDLDARKISPISPHVDRCSVVNRNFTPEIIKISRFLLFSNIFKTI